MEARPEIAKPGLIEISLEFPICRSYGFHVVRVAAAVLRAKTRSQHAILIRSADVMHYSGPKVVLPGQIPNRKGKKSLMNKNITLILLILTMTTLTSCASSRNDYLQYGMGILTQEEVARRLGAPKETMRLENGEMIWKYRFVEVNGLSYCTDYTLIFNENKVLMGVNDRCCYR